MLDYDVGNKRLISFDSGFCNCFAKKNSSFSFILQDTPVFVDFTESHYSSINSLPKVNLSQKIIKNSFFIYMIPHLIYSFFKNTILFELMVRSDKRIPVNNFININSFKSEIVHMILLFFNFLSLISSFSNNISFVSNSSFTNIIAKSSLANNFLNMFSVLLSFSEISDLPSLLNEENNINFYNFFSSNTFKLFIFLSHRLFSYFFLSSLYSNQEGLKVVIRNIFAHLSLSSRFQLFNSDVSHSSRSVNISKVVSFPSKIYSGLLTLFLECIVQPNSNNVLFNKTLIKTQFEYLLFNPVSFSDISSPYIFFNFSNKSFISKKIYDKNLRFPCFHIKTIEKKYDSDDNLGLRFPWPPLNPGYTFSFWMKIESPIRICGDDNYPVTFDNSEKINFSITPIFSVIPSKVNKLKKKSTSHLSFSQAVSENSFLIAFLSISDGNFSEYYLVISTNECQSLLKKIRVNINNIKSNENNVVIPLRSILRDSEFVHNNDEIRYWVHITVVHHIQLTSNPSSLYSSPYLFPCVLFINGFPVSVYDLLPYQTSLLSTKSRNSPRNSPVLDSSEESVSAIYYHCYFGINPYITISLYSSCSQPEFLSYSLSSSFFVSYPLHPFLIYFIYYLSRSFNLNNFLSYQSIPYSSSDQLLSTLIPFCCKRLLLLANKETFPLVNDTYSQNIHSKLSDLFSSSLSSFYYSLHDIFAPSSVSLFGNDSLINLIPAIAPPPFPLYFSDKKEKYTENHENQTVMNGRNTKSESIKEMWWFGGKELFEYSMSILNNSILPLNCLDHSYSSFLDCLKYQMINLFSAKNFFYDIQSYFSSLASSEISEFTKLSTQHVCFYLYPPILLHQFPSGILESSDTPFGLVDCGLIFDKNSENSNISSLPSQLSTVSMMDLLPMERNLSELSNPSSTSTSPTLSSSSSFPRFLFSYSERIRFRSLSPPQPSSSSSSSDLQQFVSFRTPNKFTLDFDNLNIPTPFIGKGVYSTSSSFSTFFNSPFKYLFSNKKNNFSFFDPFKNKSSKGYLSLISSSLVSLQNSFFLSYKSSPSYKFLPISHNYSLSSFLPFSFFSKSHILIKNNSSENSSNLFSEDFPCILIHPNSTDISFSPSFLNCCSPSSLLLLLDASITSYSFNISLIIFCAFTLISMSSSFSPPIQFSHMNSSLTYSLPVTLYPSSISSCFGLIALIVEKHNRLFSYKSSFDNSPMDSSVHITFQTIEILLDFICVDFRISEKVQFFLSKWNSGKLCNAMNNSSFENSYTNLSLKNPVLFNIDLFSLFFLNSEVYNSFPNIYVLHKKKMLSKIYDKNPVCIFSREDYIFRVLLFVHLLITNNSFSSYNISRLSG
jgi:hypothetical protein